MTQDDGLNFLFKKTSSGLVYIDKNLNEREQKIAQNHLKEYHPNDTQVPIDSFTTFYQNLITQLNNGKTFSRITIFSHSSWNNAPNGMGTAVNEPWLRKDDGTSSYPTDIFLSKNKDLYQQIRTYVKPRLQSAKTIIVFKSCTTSEKAAQAIAYMLGVPVVFYYSHVTTSSWISENFPYEIFIRKDPSKPDVGNPVKTAQDAKNNNYSIANPSDYIKDQLIPQVEKSIEIELQKDKKYKEESDKYEKEQNKLRNLLYDRKQGTKEYKDTEKRIQNIKKRLQTLRKELEKTPSPSLEKLLNTKASLEQEYNTIRRNACPSQNPQQEKQKPKSPSGKGADNYPGNHMQEQITRIATKRTESWTHLLNMLQEIGKRIKDAVGGKLGGHPDGLPYDTSDWLSKLSGLLAPGRPGDNNMPDSLGRQIPSSFGQPGQQKPHVPTSLKDLQNYTPGGLGTRYQDLKEKTPALSDSVDPQTHSFPKKEKQPHVRITPEKSFMFPDNRDPCSRYPSQDSLSEEELALNPMTYEKCWAMIENDEEVETGSDGFEEEVEENINRLLEKLKRIEESEKEKEPPLTDGDIEHLIDFLDELNIPMFTEEFLQDLRDELFKYRKNTYIIPEFDMRGEPITEKDKEEGIRRLRYQADEVKQYNPDSAPERIGSDMGFESLFQKTLAPRIHTSPHIDETTLFVSGEEQSRVVKELLSSSDTIKYNDPDTSPSVKSRNIRLEDYSDPINPRVHLSDSVHRSRDLQQHTLFATRTYRNTRASSSVSGDDPDA